MEIVCVGCKKVVKVKSYKSENDYKCAKCRGNPIPKKKKVGKTEESRFGVR